MSLLREGDSVNFQKASCTLDGCVKIYTSRVDSVATETGKLLSGLADSNSKKRRGEGTADGDEEEEEEEEGEDGVRKKPRKRVQRSSEATLATSFAQLELKKMELEFSVDPLFKKASADFDEGGAKGLLLNHLTVDSKGRIVFDSSDDAQETKPEETPDPRDSTEQPHEEMNEDDEKNSTPNQTGSNVDIDALAARFFPDLDILDEQDICPSLKTFELGGDAATLDIPFLKTGNDWKKDHDREKADNPIDTDLQPTLGGDDEDDDGGDLGGFDLAGDVGFGEGGEAWAKEAAIQTQTRPYDAAFDNDLDDNPSDAPGDVGAYDPNSAAYGVTLSQTSHDTENILTYFDKALAKNWVGPEHWRIRKIKDANSAKAAPNAPRQRKEKEPFTIDFTAPLTRAQYNTIYTPATSTSAISLPKAQWRSKTRNLLPDDKHFNSKQLLRLFLKPKARIGARSFAPSSSDHDRRAPPPSDEDDPDQAEMDPAFWARRHAEQAALQAAEADGAAAATGDYDANFFQDDALGPAGVDMDIDDGGDGGGLEFADAREHLSPDIVGDSGELPSCQDGADGAGGGFGSQLVTQSRRVRPEYVQYARVAKKVDVRRLKEEMWRGMGPLEIRPPSFSPGRAADRAQESQQQQQPDATSPTLSGKPSANDAAHDDLKFTSIMNGLQAVYPAQAMSDISTSYCFICLLHLANEKGLELRNEEMGRFEEVVVKRDWSAGESGEGEV